MSSAFVRGYVSRIISGRKKLVNASDYAAMWDRLSTKFA